MKKTLLSLFLSLVAVSLLFAQKGTFRGVVTDGKTGETLIGVVITQKGTNKGATTDLDGKFSMNLDPGTYDFVFSDLIFGKKVVSGVKIESGQVTTLNIQMEEQKNVLKEVVVSAQTLKNTEVSVLNIKKNSVNFIDGVSSQFLSKMGDSSVATAIKRVSGVSVSEGKYIFVRGLGDRYSKTTFNGIEIPGLDPDRNSLQLDLFPTSIVDNLLVYKTFTPDMSADFSGGVLDIASKYFPDSKIMSVKVSVGFNPNANFKSDFSSYASDKGADNFALGASSRKDPQVDESTLGFHSVGNTALAEATRKFSKEMAVEQMNSGINHEIELSLGNQINGKNLSYGYLLVMGYQKDFEAYENAEYNKFQKPGSKDEREMNLVEGSRSSIGVENVLWNTLLSLSMKSKQTKYSLSFLHIQNGIKRAEDLFQHSTSFSSSPGLDLYKDYLYYNQRTLNNLFLDIKRTSKDKKTTLEFKLSPTLSTINEPDFRQTVFVDDIDRPGVVTIKSGDGGQVVRSFRYLEEKSISTRMDVERQFKQWNDLKSKFKFGVAYTYKNRDYKVTNYRFLEPISRSDYSTDNPNELFTDENLFNPSTGLGLYVTGASSPINQYNSVLNIASAYAMTELPINEKLKATFGLRWETAVMYYTGTRLTPRKAYNAEKVLDDNDLFPSLALVYQLNPESNLRFSASKTIARPSFKEKSYIQIIDPFSEISSDNYFLGNINLKSSRTQNYDLRYENYFGKNEMFSVSAFSKFLEQPIELVYYSASSFDFTFKNSGRAQLIGFEFEGRISLSRLAPWLSSFVAGTNISYVVPEWSKIKITDEEYESKLKQARTGEEISRYRLMQGLAPLSINAYITYSSKRVEATINYNRQDESLAIVGSNAKPDVYQQELNFLNVVGSFMFGKENRCKVKVGIKNLLDQDKVKKYQYGFRDKEDSEIFRKYAIGRTFSLSFSYAL